MSDLNILPAARSVFVAHGLNLAPLWSASASASGVSAVFNITQRLGGSMTRVHPFNDMDDALAYISSLSRAVVEGRETAILFLRRFITETGLFGNLDVVAKSVVRNGLAGVGAKLCPEMDAEIPRAAEIYTDEAAVTIARIAGLENAAPSYVVELLTRALVAEAAPAVDMVRMVFPTSLRSACDALAFVPADQITYAHVDFYAGRDADGAIDAGTAEKRQRSARIVPFMAAQFVNRKTITEAIDNGTSLFDACNEASKGMWTKPLLTRLAKASRPEALYMVDMGAFADFPPDQLPKDERDWDFAMATWKACSNVAASLGIPVSEIWNHRRLSQVKGDWRGLADSVVKRASDDRAPHDLGLVKDVAEKAAVAMGFRPIERHESPYQVTNRMIADGYRALVAANIPVDEIETEKLRAWALNVCMDDPTPAALEVALNSLIDASHIFGQHVILPSILAEMGIPGLPITGDILSAANKTAWNVLSGQMALPQLAEFGRNFRARTALLTAPIVTSRDRGNVVKAEPKQIRQKVDKQILSADTYYRECFGYTDEKPEWPGLTPIVEVMPGIVVVPMTTIKQGREEGTLQRGPVDRKGVPELNVCIGINYAPSTLLDGGKSQIISIREVGADGSYKRLAAAVLYPMIGAETQQLVIPMPREGGHHFNGLNNCQPSAIAHKALKTYIQLIEDRKIPVSNEIKFRMEGESITAERVVRDFTLPKLIGYMPFESFKIAAAWERWSQHSLLGKEWTKMPLPDRVAHDLMMPARAAVEATAARLGVLLEGGIGKPPPDEKPQVGTRKESSIPLSSRSGRPPRVSIFS